MSIKIIVMQNADLVKKLRENIKIHMMPYNLGDMGETAKLVQLACDRLENYNALVEMLNDKLSSLYAVRDFAIRGNNISVQQLANAKIELLQTITDQLNAHK